MDIDVFTRSGTRQEKALLSDSEWMQVDHIINSLFLINNKLVSEELKVEIRAEIDGQIEPEALGKLEKMVKEGIFHQ